MTYSVSDANYIRTAPWGCGLGPEDVGHPDVVYLRSCDRTARKTLRRACDICHGEIEAGQRYRDEAIILDGKFETMVAHIGGCPKWAEMEAKRKAWEAAEAEEYRLAMLADLAQSAEPPVLYE